ncbi:hypothetical protein IGI04_035223 [Brassica rapa subsp. trilocularis]|uniref:FBD domain-containing protein n=1 Tax=Brassica rapa subsp. trilocularis TaxID=1813537 RepID=A0ABQ7LB33_BRACM|nr:hypothetical protein IGI04_035223 [Brassica rapa subsp. trilocularis]
MASGPDPNSFSDGAKRDEATTKVPSKDPKKKDDKKEEDLSEEDLKLKQNLELYVERVQDPNPELQKAALKSMRRSVPQLHDVVKLHDVVRPDAKEVVMAGTWSDATDVETLCLLAELKHLKKLRKLSITINKGGEFTVSQLFVDIQDFSNLEKLKVAWGASHKAPKKVAVPSHLPEKLMKLDLQCFPDAELPSLLEPGKLRMLKKLYIKGGTKLTGFGKSVPEKPTECSVKVLRLKFLPSLKVEWRELRELYFTKLEFLDKYQSPQREELAKAIADARQRQEAQLKDNHLLANPCTACLKTNKNQPKTFKVYESKIGKKLSPIKE